MKSIIVVEIDHEKPVPAELANVTGNRVYNWLFAKGIEADIKVRSAEVTAADE